MSTKPTRKSNRSFKEGDRVRCTSKEFKKIYNEDQNVFAVQGLTTDNRNNPLWLCRPAKPLPILGNELCYFQPDQLEEIS